MHLRSIWACFQYLWYFMSRGIWSSFYRGMEPRRAKTWLMWGCSGIHHRWEGCPRQAQLRPEPWRAARMHLCWPRQQFFPTFVDFTIKTSLSTSPWVRSDLSREISKKHSSQNIKRPRSLPRGLFLTRKRLSIRTSTNQKRKHRKANSIESKTQKLRLWTTMDVFAQIVTCVYLKR